MENFLSIVIVNYNGKRFLKPCLDSVARFVTVPHEVIIVDNASSDGSVDYIRENFRDIRLVASAINTGFTGGNNVGVKEAKGNLVLLLNNDTELLGPLDAVINEMADPAVGVAGARLFYGDRRQQASVGYRHTPLRIVGSWLGLKGLCGRCFSLFETDSSYYEERHADVDWVSGAFLLTRKTLWDQLHGLDDTFFMYVEDVDYCERIKKLGLKVVYQPQTQVIHYEGAGKVWIGKMALLRTCRSYLLYLPKHYSRAAQAFTGLALGALFMLRGLSYRLDPRAQGREVRRDKAVAFSEAGRYLMRGAMSPLTLKDRV